MAVMQKGADRTEKVECRIQWFAAEFRLARFRRRPGPLFVQGRKQREPGSYVVIAQSPGRFFHVWLKMKNRVAVLGVTGAGDFGELLNNVVAFAQEEFW